VNLALSKRGDYVLRSAIYLARSYESGTPKKLRQVSAEMGVPRTFVSQILGDLARAGLAVSFFGTHGGYCLTRPPAEVSLLEVVESAEGALAPETCVLGDGPCRWESVCPLHETWGTAAAALRTVLAATSLADLVERDLEIEVMKEIARKHWWARRRGAARSRMRTHAACRADVPVRCCRWPGRPWAINRGWPKRTHR